MGRLTAKRFIFLYLLSHNLKTSPLSLVHKIKNSRAKSYTKLYLMVRAGDLDLTMWNYGWKCGSHQSSSIWGEQTEERNEATTSTRAQFDGMGKIIILGVWKLYNLCSTSHFHINGSSSKDFFFSKSVDNTDAMTSTRMSKQLVCNIKPLNTDTWQSYNDFM